MDREGGAKAEEVGRGALSSGWSLGPHKHEEHQVGEGAHLSQK